MDNFKTFGEAIRAYRKKERRVTNKRTGKQLRPLQKLLLYGADPATISRKLNGEEPLYDVDVREITSNLVWWGLVTRRSQLQQLFDLAGCPLSGDWQEEPWKSLIDDTRLPEEAMLLQNANLEDRKNDLPVKQLVLRETPEIHNLRLPRNPFFTGREELLKLLRQQLQENGSVAINQPVSISGLGGIGKTQLALEYAYQSYQTVYKAVFWVDAANEEALQSGYKDLADLLELPGDPGKYIQAVKAWLEGHADWLLILDNADDLPLARSFLPAKPGGHIVVTTRSQIVSALGTKTAHIEIEEMKPTEGLLFLLRRVGMTQDTADIRKAATQLVQLLGGYPLALDQACAYIEETKVSFADYIQLYQEARQQLLVRRGSEANEHGNHPESVAATVELSIKRAYEQYPLAADILYFCAFLDPVAMSEELVRRADGCTFDPLPFNEAVFALRRYSLITVREKVLSMHRLVQDVLIDTMSLDLRREWFLRVQRTLCKASQEEYEKAQALRERKESTTALETMTEMYEQRKQGKYLSSHAQSALSRADAMREDGSSITHLFLFGWPVFSVEEREHSDRAYREGIQRKFGSKVRSQQELLAEADRFVAEHPDVIRNITPLSNTADLYMEYGRYEQADALCERAATVHYVGVVDMEMVLAFLVFAQLSQRLGKLDRAARLYQRALSALEQRAATHPYTQGVRKGYATFLRSIGRDAEAVAIESSQGPDGGTYPPLSEVEELLLDSGTPFFYFDLTSEKPED